MLSLQTNISNIKEKQNTNIHENIKSNMFVHARGNAFECV